MTSINKYPAQNMIRRSLKAAFMAAVLAMASARPPNNQHAQKHLQKHLQKRPQKHPKHQQKKHGVTKRAKAFWHPYKRAWPNLAAASVACQDGLVSESEARKYKWVALDPAVFDSKKSVRDAWCGKKLRVTGPKGSQTAVVVDQQGAGGIDLQEEAFKRVCGPDNCNVSVQEVG